MPTVDQKDNQEILNSHASFFDEQIKRQAEMYQKVEEIVAKIPSWVPVIPEYLRFKTKEAEAGLALVWGIDPTTGEKIGTVEERLKRAAKLEGESLVAGFKSAIDIVMFLGAGIPGKVAKNEAAAAVAEKLGLVAGKDGAKVLAEAAPGFFASIADKVKDETAKAAIKEAAEVMGKLVENPITKKVLVEKIKGCEIFTKAQEMFKGSEARARKAQEAVQRIPITSPGAI